MMITRHKSVVATVLIAITATVLVAPDSAHAGPNADRRKAILKAASDRMCAGWFTTCTKGLGESTTIKGTTPTMNQYNPCYKEAKRVGSSMRFTYKGVRRNLTGSDPGQCTVYVITTLGPGYVIRPQTAQDEGVHCD